MNILNFAQDHQEILIAAVFFIIGLILSKAKAKLFGKKVGQKIPKKIRIELIEYLESFKEGLINADVDGNTSLITNEQLTKETEKLKINLGLDQR